MAFAVPIIALLTGATSMQLEETGDGSGFVPNPPNGSFIVTTSTANNIVTTSTLNALVTD